MNFSITNSWNPLQAEMRDCLRRAGKEPEAFGRGLELCLELNALTHFSPQGAMPGFMDMVCQDVSESALRAVSPANGHSLAWNIWHINRIEDLIVNLLIAEGQQVLDAELLRAVGSPITDTGNALTRPEIAEFSSSISLEGLNTYSRALAARTKTVLSGLHAEDLKRKPSARALERIMEEGGLTEQEDSFWLRDFWGGKTVAGLLVLPVTRHRAVHLNECQTIKKKVLPKR